MKRWLDSLPSEIAATLGGVVGILVGVLIVLGCAWWVRRRG